MTVNDLGARAAIIASIGLATMPCAAEVEASVEAGLAVPTVVSEGSVYMGPVLGIRGGYRFADRHSLGLTVRYYDAFALAVPNFPGRQDIFLGAIDYRIRLGTLDNAHPFLGAFLGYGFSDMCLQGDLCGTMGPVVGVSAGLGVPLSKQVSWDSAIEFASHGFPVIVLPAVVTSLTWTP